MTQVPEAVHALDRTLREIFGGRLQSLVAYGLHSRAHLKSDRDRHGPGAHESAATRGAPGALGAMTYTLAIVSTLSTEDLRACAARVGAWHDAGLATPLLISADEFGRSLDAFPFEF